MRREDVRRWMAKQVPQLKKECEDDEDVIEYLVENTNSECGTDYEDEELRTIVESVLEDPVEDQDIPDLGRDDEEEEDPLPPGMSYREDWFN